MPLVGFGLLLTGALWMYLFVSPGVMSPPTNADAGAETGAP